MEKTIISKTKRLREAEKKKEREERLKYYKENKEKINRRHREKQQKAKELKSAQHAVLEGDTNDNNGSAKAKREKWALYKRQQRAKAKEEAKKKEEKSQMRKNKCKLQTNEVSSSRAFPTRMAKRCQVDLVKSHLPESPAKKVAVVAALIESPTTRSGLECKGLIPSAENREEADVALSVMRDARDAISVTKSQRSN